MNKNTINYIVEETRIVPEEYEFWKIFHASKGWILVNGMSEDYLYHDRFLSSRGNILKWILSNTSFYSWSALLIEKNIKNITDWILDPQNIKLNWLEKWSLDDDISQWSNCQTAWEYQTVEGLSNLISEFINGSDFEIRLKCLESIWKYWKKAAYKVEQLNSVLLNEENLDILVSLVETLYAVWNESSSKNLLVLLEKTWIKIEQMWIAIEQWIMKYNYKYSAYLNLRYTILFTLFEVNPLLCKKLLNQWLKSINHLVRRESEELLERFEINKIIQ